jgi:hypothetical protein
MDNLTAITDGYTLKMFADATGKRHDNVKRDFNKMLDNLSGDILTLLSYDERDFTTKRGNTYKTIVMNKFTALLFASKFNDNLRANLLILIEEQTEQLIKYQQKLIEEQQKHKLVTYSDDTKSLRKIIKMYYPDILGERETWRYLVKIGIVKYVPRETYVKELIDNRYGKQIQDSIAWDEDEICKVLDRLAEEKENETKYI